MRDCQEKMLSIGYEVGDMSKDKLKMVKVEWVESCIDYQLIREGKLKFDGGVYLWMSAQNM